MRTAIRIPNPGIGTFDYQRGRTDKHRTWRKPLEEKKAPAKREYNHFLTGKIQPFVPDYRIQVNENVPQTVNLTTKESFDYLYKSALRYTQLMGVELPFRKKERGNPRINIINLYKVVDNLLPEHVNLEVKEDRLHFCLYRFHDWPDCTLFWIPLDFTRKLPRLLKRITLEFIRQFVRYHGLQDITETGYYDMAIEYLEDYGDYNAEASPREIRRNADLAYSYQKGAINRILERMKGRRFCNDPKGAISECHPLEKNEQKLLELIKEGLTLTASGNPRIMEYYYDWAYEESPDFWPIGLETQIMLVYSENDALCAEMESYFNSDYRESYAITPVTTHYLTPEMERLFSMDDYPEKISDWLNRFLQHVSNNF